MRFPKRIFLICTLLLSATMIFGCSSSPKTNDGGAADKEPILVGANMELTGNSAEYGNNGFNGMKLAFDEVNAAGGVLDGRLIQLIEADNKSEPGEATSATTKLITQDGVMAILGPMTSSPVIGSAQLVTDNQVILITPSGTNVHVTVDEDGNLRPWLFRACMIDSFQGEVAANFALDTLGAQKAAIIYDQGTDYSYGLAENFRLTFEAAGMTIIAEEKFASGDTDFRTILTNVKAANPDVVFVPSYYNQAGMIVKQARELGMEMPFMGGDGWATGTIDTIAEAALENTYFVDHAATDDPALQDFVQKYEAAYGVDADGFAALGYDSAMMLVAAIEQAGSDDPEAVRSALENLTDFQGVTGTMTIDPATHNPVKSAVIQQFIVSEEGAVVKSFLERVNPK